MAHASSAMISSTTRRRHAIFAVVRHSVGMMLRNSQDFGVEQERDFSRAMEQAYYFFGDDVENYLEQLWKDIVTVRAADQVLGGTPGARKPSSRPRASLRSR
jgi:hypothetical protein